MRSIPLTEHVVRTSNVLAVHRDSGDSIETIRYKRDLRATSEAFGDSERTRVRPVIIGDPADAQRTQREEKHEKNAQTSDIPRR